MKKMVFVHLNVFCVSCEIQKLFLCNMLIPIEFMQIYIDIFIKNTYFFLLKYIKILDTPKISIRF